ncbi:TetR/AcrR family transcriptional regulator [Pseudokineococcus marinus]
MAPKAPRRGRPPATSRREVVRTALRLFDERGFEATTLEDVAAALGVGRTTVLRHVESKSAIVWEGLEGAEEALVDGLRDAPVDRPWREALLEALVAGQRYPDDDLELLRLRLLVIGSEPALRGVVASAGTAGDEAVEAFVAARGPWAADAPEPHALAQATRAAAVAGLAWWARSGRGDPRDAVRAALVAVLGREPTAAG